MAFRNKGQNRLKYLFRYLAHFLETKLANVVAIGVKTGPKGRGFSHPISSKITLGKERNEEIERARRMKGGKEEKNNGWFPSCLSIGYFRYSFWLKKKNA